MSPAAARAATAKRSEPQVANARGVDAAGRGSLRHGGCRLLRGSRRRRMWESSQRKVDPAVWGLWDLFISSALERWAGVLERGRGPGHGPTNAKSGRVCTGSCHPCFRGVGAARSSSCAPSPKRLLSFSLRHPYAFARAIRSQAHHLACSRPFSKVHWHVSWHWALSAQSTQSLNGRHPQAFRLSIKLPNHHGLQQSLVV